jgi:hypothetical protein
MPVRVNQPAFERLRTINQALTLTPGDLGGPVLRVLDDVAREAAKSGIRSEGAGAWPALTEKYRRWKESRGYGTDMMIMDRPYRGRGAQQLLRGFTLANDPRHVRRWIGPSLRWQFGISDGVAAMHEYGGPRLPRRSVLDSIYAARALFVAAFKEFYVARVRQVTRHL